MVDLNVFSWNVRGLNSPIKRTRCLQFLHHNVDLALIQESHLKQEDVHRFQNRRFKIIAFSCANNKSKGVVILVKRYSQLTVHLTGKDTNGRFAYAIVSISSKKILFASIYSPNDFDADFLNGISNTLLSFVDCSLFIRGDFNATVNPLLDRSPASNCFPSSTVALNQFITELNLTDVWRIKNTDTKAYSFYSAPHKSLSRIDYILVSSSLLDQICESDILPRLISDHSPTQCRIKPPSSPPKFRRWRFNDSLLSNSEFIENLRTELQEFISLNQTEYCNPQVIWETTKCFLRGFCIAYSSKLKSRNILRDNYSELTQKITADLQRWSSLRISKQARVTILKMNVLPRFNFLFFMLPMQPPKFFLKKYTLTIFYIYLGGQTGKDSFLNTTTA
uniref:exodeoxyribonuclease III n=1 Tax=Acanthochromis polyacanthus TaxID=80966 RepID=A0A3Q1FS38_9TELE